MSAPRFASISSTILARKGEAQPWAELHKQPLAWDTVEPVRMFDSPPYGANDTLHAVPEHEHLHADLKKCSVRMSHHDYERLGILAVKQGKTRQRLLQEAVDRMLEGISHSRFAGGCACLGDDRCPPRF
jgi:hypothetical protein